MHDARKEILHLPANESPQWKTIMQSSALGTSGVALGVHGLWMFDEGVGANLLMNG